MLFSLKNTFYIDALLCLGYAVFYFCARRPIVREVGWKPLIIFLLLTTAPMLSPTLWLYHIFFAGVILAVPKDREEVGLVYLAACLATPPFAQWQAVGGHTLIAFSVHDTAVVAALVALFSKPGRTVRRRSITDLAALLMLVLLTFIAGRDASATQLLRGGLNALLAFWLPYYLVTRSLASPESLRKVGLWLVVATAMLSAAVIFEAARVWPLYAEMQKKFNPTDVNDALVKIRLGWLRAEGPFTDATITGVVAVVGGAAVFLSRPIFASTTKYLLMLAVAGGMLMAPQSRGAWLGAAVLLVAVTAYRSRKNLLLKAIPTVAGASILAMFAAKWGGSETIDSVDYRQRLWTRGVEEFWKSPLFGDAPQNVYYHMRDLRQGEGIVDFVNSYLYFALMSGLLGVVLFVATFCIASINLWTRRSALNPAVREFDAAAFLFGLLVSSMVMFAFTSFTGRLTLLTAITFGLVGNLLVAPKSRASMPKRSIAGRPAAARGVAASEPWQVATP